MNKTELVEQISSRTALTKTDAHNALDATLQTIVEAVSRGEEVSLTGFSSFKASKRSAREGKNPRTGEKISIAAKTLPKFVSGALFKDAVNNK